MKLWRRGTDGEYIPRSCLVTCGAHTIPSSVQPSIPTLNVLQASLHAPRLTTLDTYSHCNLLDMTTMKISDILASQVSLLQEASEALPHQFSQCTYNLGYISAQLVQGDIVAIVL